MKSFTTSPDYSLSRNNKKNILWQKRIRKESIKLISEYYGAPERVAINVYDQLCQEAAQQAGKRFWGLDLRYDGANQKIDRVAYCHD